MAGKKRAKGASGRLTPTHSKKSSWRQANASHVSLAQLKVMSAIKTCRTAALGGHVERCEDCAHERISYNSCLMGTFSNGELAVI